MAASRLTQRVIDALQPEPGTQYIRWDAAVRGFGVRVSPAGTKTYVFKYRLPTGRVRWKTVGRVATLTLEKARRQAQADAGEVASGRDPLSDKDAAQTAVTVSVVAERFLREHVEARRKPSTVRQYRAAIDDEIRPRLGALSIGEVNSDHAVRLHARLRTTPRQANIVLAVLSSLLSWSVKAKYRPGPNPCFGLETFPERRRERYLDAAEYARLARAFRSVALAPGPRLAIQLCLLTGARPAEIASLQWAHVDLRSAALRLPESKTGAKTIHLPEAAVRLLRRWPQWESPYVFPGTERGVRAAHMHPSTLTHAWGRLREPAGLTDVRLYDACRHSFASMAISQHGLTLVQVGAQLGHTQPATTSRYAHLHADVARANADLVGGSIASALRLRR
jgi:integrase